MELSKFINETLKQIIEGIILAQDWALSKDALINPHNITFSGNNDSILFDSETGRPAQMIDFEISLLSIDTDEFKGGGGIFVGIAKLGTGAKSITAKNESGRIKFSIPVLFPTSTEKKNE